MLNQVNGVVMLEMLDPPEETPILVAPPSNVTVRFKQNKPIEIEIDQDAITWKDLKALKKFGDVGADEEKGEEALFALLQKLTGQDLSEQPPRVINAVLAQLSQLSGAMGNPNA